MTRNHIRMIILGGTSLIGLILLIANIYIIDEGDRCLVVNLGKIDRLQTKGLNLKVPFVEAKHCFSIRTTPGEFTDLEAYTSDNQIIKAALLVPYRVREEQIAEIYAKYGPAFETRLMLKLIEGSFIEELGNLNTITLATERDAVGRKIGDLLKKQLRPFGIIVDGTNVKLNNMDFSKEFDARIARALEEKAEVEKARQNARRKEQEAIARRAQAKGEADAVREKADGEAYRNETVAIAEAKAIRLKADANAHAVRVAGAAEAQRFKDRAASVTPNLVKLLRAEAALRWNGQLPQRYIPGSALPILEMKADPQ